MDDSGADVINESSQRPEPRGLSGPVILLGLPGVGKGTQAEALAAVYGVPHLSTGDMFRENVERGTEIGRQVRALMERGDLVPDDIVVAMVARRIAQPDCARGFILDGFPRTVVQAEALDGFIGDAGLAEPLVLLIDVDRSLILRRLSGRRVCKVDGEIYNIYDRPPRTPGRCDRDNGELVQRDDDRENVIRERLATYQRHTEPVIEFYRRRRLVVEASGAAAPEAVTRALVELIDRKEGRGR